MGENSEATPNIPGTSRPLDQDELRRYAVDVSRGMDGVFAHPFGNPAAIRLVGERVRPVALRRLLSQGLPFRG